MSASSSSSEKLSYYQMAQQGYQELVNAIIRPPRANYKMESLGPLTFSIRGKQFIRQDLSLTTKRGLNIQCSFWKPTIMIQQQQQQQQQGGIGGDDDGKKIPVMIYMHGNSSARIEVLPQLSYLLCLGLAVFAFDFTGSGHSNGDYVTLGYYEREDLECVVDYLRSTSLVSFIALWGRSMGAATALMYGERDPSIACMILDSPFTDLTRLAEEMVDKGRDQGIIVPTFLVNVALSMISSSIEKQANVSMKDISPIQYAHQTFIPALFVTGKQDEFIKSHHAKDIYTKYAGDKQIIVVDGGHNSPRPKHMFDTIAIFLQTYLQQLVVIPSLSGTTTTTTPQLIYPPWCSQEAEAVTTTRTKLKPPSSSSSATTTGGYDHEQVGMTQERQREIQSSLFKMLGQEGNNDHEQQQQQQQQKNRGNSATTVVQTPTVSNSAATTSMRLPISATIATGVPVNHHHNNNNNSTNAFAVKPTSTTTRSAPSPVSQIPSKAPAPAPAMVDLLDFSDTTTTNSPAPSSSASATMAGSNAYYDVFQSPPADATTTTTTTMSSTTIAAAAAATTTKNDSYLTNNNATISNNNNNNTNLFEGLSQKYQSAPAPAPAASTSAFSFIAAPAPSTSAFGFTTESPKAKPAPVMTNTTATIVPGATTATITSSSSSNDYLADFASLSVSQTSEPITKKQVMGNNQGGWIQNTTSNQPQPKSFGGGTTYNNNMPLQDPFQMGQLPLSQQQPMMMIPGNITARNMMQNGMNPSTTTTTTTTTPMAMNGNFSSFGAMGTTPTNINRGGGMTNSTPGGMNSLDMNFGDMNSWTSGKK